MDVGTTSVKAVAVDAEGAVVARTRVAHRVGTPSAELLEHDVAQAWRRGPRRAFAAVSAELDGPAAGVVVTSMVPSITAVDRRGTPLLPGLLYGDERAADRRLSDEGADVDQRQSAERYQGRRMLEWAVGECPGAKGYWNCQAVATHALSGVPAVDQATATSFGGLYEGGRWDKEALHDLGLGEAQLPVVGGMGQGIGIAPRDAHGVRRWVDRRLLRADRGRGHPAGRRAGHLRGHADRLGGGRGVARRARSRPRCRTSWPAR